MIVWKGSFLIFFFILYMANTDKKPKIEKYEIYSNVCIIFTWRYNWNIIESGVKHHNPNPILTYEYMDTNMAFFSLPLHSLNISPTDFGLAFSTKGIPLR